jgi:hypothetical protein
MKISGGPSRRRFRNGRRKDTSCNRICSAKQSYHGEERVSESPCKEARKVG